MKKKQFTQKQKLSILKKSEEIGVKKSAEVVGVHYTTVYEWRKYLNIMGEKTFLDYKPSSPGRGIKDITPEQESAILKTMKNNPGYGPGQVKSQLRRQGVTISIKTIRKIMSSNGYKSPKKSKKKRWQRFEARRPLELAQMDILEFYINKLKIYLILLIDDFSRFILGWSLLEKTSVDEVIAVVKKAMDRYGKMEEILTDRGFVFYSWRGINRFEKFLELKNIDHTHAKPHHPQTLGKVEACNRRIKNELIDQKRFLTAADATDAIEKWVEHYNYNRPHQGIGGHLVPAERFHGQADQALASISRHLDITKGKCYTAKINRSVVNLVVGPDGDITLYLMGHPITLSGMKNVEKNEC